MAIMTDVSHTEGDHVADASAIASAATVSHMDQVRLIC